MAQVCGEGGNQGETETAPQLKPVLNCAGIADKLPVFDGHSFRLPGGTRRIDDLSHIVRRRQAPRRFITLLLNRLPIRIEQHDARMNIGQLANQVRLR